MIYEPTGTVLCPSALRIVSLSESMRALTRRPNRESNPADKNNVEWG